MSKFSLCHCERSRQGGRAKQSFRPEKIASSSLKNTPSRNDTKLLFFLVFFVGWAALGAGAALAQDEQNSDDKSEIVSCQLLTTENAQLKDTINQLGRERNGLQSRLKELADTHYNLGVILQEQYKFDEAQKEYEKVLELRPDDADAHYNLALIFDTAKNDRNMALYHYEKYLEINPRAAEAQGVRQSIARLSK
ncbi:MAG: tetratricopeptide repeat protein [Candidatus Omnitrophica bacterium]|nr:tetratricopeptide repeat protein [Candidatus Omnitrophota bacterium]